MDVAAKTLKKVFISVNGHLCFENHSFAKQLCLAKGLFQTRTVYLPRYRLRLDRFNTLSSKQLRFKL